MNFKFGAPLAGIFLVALLAATIAQFSRRVDQLQGELERSEHHLQQQARQAGPPSSDASTPPQVSETPVPRSGLPTESRSTQEFQALSHDVLAPSVQVNGPGGVGGGTILYTAKAGTYVVTAYHVVHKSSEAEDLPLPPPAPIEVRLYGPEGEVEECCEGQLAASDERKDLALLRIQTEHVTPTAARLANRETLRSIHVFTPIYAMGCPLGHDPLPTLGEVATLHKEVGGEKFWMMNAPTIFGNSGGGIFHRETRELVGVSVMICTYDGVVSTPVPHLGILVSLESVYDWLDSLHYQFVYDPASPPDSGEHARIRTAPATPPPPGGLERSSFQDAPSEDP
jgi:S1-C subfamily serine protease